MPEQAAIETLSALLQSSQAQPRLRTERLVPSAYMISITEPS